MIIRGHVPHLPRRLSPLRAAQEHTKEVGRRNALITGIAIVAMVMVAMLAIALLVHATRPR